MKRREFLSASIVAGAATAIPAMAKKSKQLYYEFSRYQVVNNAAKKSFEAYWEKAAIPALNRLGMVLLWARSQITIVFACPERRTRPTPSTRKCRLEGGEIGQVDVIISVQIERMNACRRAFGRR